MCRTLLLVLLVLVALFANSYATLRDVPADYPTIQSAIDASVNHDTVLVANGTYFENINYHGRSIVVMSNYSITHDPIDIWNTIIDGSNPVHPDTGSCVLIISGEDSTTALDGFTITGGTSTPLFDDGGGGVFVEGGGVLIEDASPRISNNYIVGNEATRTYAGIISAGGGGIKVGFSSSLIINNVIIENNARYGGGMCINYATPTVKNNVFVRNFGGQDFAGGGIAVFGTNQHSIFDNNVVVGNSSVQPGGGIKIFGSILESHNNIIWGNRANTGAQQISGSILQAGMTYSCIQGGWAGTGNIDSYPDFFRLYLLLQPTSPCVDTGDPNVIYNDPGGSRADMGIWGGPSGNTMFLFASDPHLFTAITAIDFGEVAVGVSDTAYLTIQNRGVGNLVLDSALAAPVAIINFPDSIRPFSLDTLALMWTPTAAGDLNTTLQIYHNDATQPWPYSILLVGHTPVSADPVNSEIPTEFALHQNFPNPFNNSTQISFDIPSTSFATLEIFDTQGRVVSQLVNETLQPGSYQVNWNALNAATGVYFCRMHTASFEQVQKMILLK